MKRSGAIREIKSIIATCGPTQPTIVTAEQVLSRLEKLGMLPPPLQGVVKVEEHENKLVIPVWSWETED